MAEILPTMTDDTVMDFVASGYVVLEGIVDEDFNQHCSTALKGAQVSALINSPEFVREVLLQAQIAGVARSLLGADFLDHDPARFALPRRRSRGHRPLRR